jgi:hypothetical protein
MKLTRALRFLSRPHRRAADIAAAAGQAAQPGARRGSVLVLVLGALALISVVTLVYVTVGKGDIRTATTTLERSRTDTTVQSIADYLNGVISRSALATFVDGVDNGQPIVIRKAWDFPFVDSYRRSVSPNSPPNAADLARQFNATGSYSDLVTGIDQRLPYQPWLATTVPTDLVPGNLAPPLPFDLGRDLGMISNFAPDGRFVNLWNLAPYVNTGPGYQRVSRFDAAPVRLNSNGTPNVPTFSPAFAEMSYGLTLLGANGVSFPANGPQNLPANLGPADPNIPAHWTMWQYRAHRLAGKDPNYGPSSPEYAPYQWADADGDGRLDSRWFELVNAYDPANPISILPRDDRFRWFIAARAIDLGALVNINTATDLRQPPRQVNGATQVQVTPLGLDPSDIDLYRLLRMDDTRLVYGIGYDDLQIVAGETYDPDYGQGLARTLGERAYNAIRWSLTRNSAEVPDPTIDLTTTANGQLAPLTGDARAQYYQYWGGQNGASYYSQGGANRFSLSGRFGPAELLELLTFHGLNDPRVTSRLEQATEGRSNAATGGNVNESRMGPLRGTRTAAAEIGTADDDENAGLGNGFADDDAFIHEVTNVRKHLTTVSNDRPIMSRVVPAANLGKLDANDLTTLVQPLAKQTGTPKDLFAAYSDALLPYSWRTNLWTTNFGRLKTLSYAHNPEIALRFAAHLAANFQDMYDKTDTQQRKQPGAYTLLFDSGQRNNLTGNNNYPWWDSNGQLDLGATRLPPAVNNTTPHLTQTAAINIFGIEAQPFITQVSSIVIYTDAPQSAGGDDETNGGTTEGENITISGAVSTAPPPARPNSDFLGEILAFQITNPFDVDVPLSQWDHTTNFQQIQDPSYTEYYLEYNGKLFKFAADNGTNAEGIVLRKGETRTFYVLSMPLSDMQTRFAAVWANPNVPIPPNAVERFIDNQLALPALPGYTYTAAEQAAGGTRVKPIRLRGMNATTGNSEPVAGDFFAGNGIRERKTVYLWRKLERQPGGPRPPADRSTHMLADRLYDPGTAQDPDFVHLDRRRIATDPGIGSTNAGPETYQPDPDNDNSGFTIALWGSIKRADNPIATPVGALPAYCVEHRWPTVAHRNFVDTDGTNPAQLSESDFDPNTRRNARLTVQDFLDWTMIGAAGPTRLPSPANPGLYDGVFILANNTYATMTVAAHMKRYTPHLMKNNVNNVSYAKLYPQLALDNNEFQQTMGVLAPAPIVSTLRVADMLLPLAIGPEYDPGLNNGQLPDELDPGESLPKEQCLTLSEALAIGLNYNNPPQTGDAFSIYHRIGDNTPPPHPALPSSGALDRGYLNLNDFAPYEDQNADGTFQPLPGGRDVSRWPGIPMGLNVLNIFSTMDSQFGGLTKGTPGRINLNTASLPVMRTIPLLSPSTDISSLPTSNNDEWEDFKILAGFAATDRPLTDITCDIAAAVVAYRDKTRVLTRDATPPGAVVNFEDSIIDPFVAAGADGRRVTNQIDGIREAPGFASVGELMAVRARGDQNTARIRVIDRIDQLGVDDDRSGTNGTASVLYKDPTAVAGTKSVDGMTDDYGEQLIVAQAAMNSVTVRSDVFAVWFIVHGYQKSDTENLGATDPLVPSVAKRFVMVLDRSNVTRAGEKAKVLLFTEVPMTP